MRPFAEVFPELAAKITQDAALNEESGQEPIVLYMDRDVLAAWQASGPNWRERMSAALRAAISVKA